MKKKFKPSKVGWKGCRSKKRYASEYEAGHAISARMKDGSPKLRAYDCGGCQGWHITKKEA